MSWGTGLWKESLMSQIVGFLKIMCVENTGYLYCQRKFVTVKQTKKTLFKNIAIGMRLLWYGNENEFN